MGAPVIYMDNNATTRVAPEVLEAMLPFFTERYGNASSMHAFGGAIHADLERAREKVAALIHADPSEIVFTSWSPLIRPEPPISPIWLMESGKSGRLAPLSSSLQRIICAKLSDLRSCCSNSFWLNRSP